MQELGDRQPKPGVTLLGAGDLGEKAPSLVYPGNLGAVYRWLDMSPGYVPFRT